MSIYSWVDMNYIIIKQLLSIWSLDSREWIFLTTNLVRCIHSMIWSPLEPMTSTPSKRDSDHSRSSEISIFLTQVGMWISNFSKISLTCSTVKTVVTFIENVPKTFNQWRKILEKIGLWEGIPLIKGNNRTSSTKRWDFRSSVC